MKLEDLQKELETDTLIDGTKLQYEAAHNPNLHAKWLRIYSDAKKELIKLDAQRKRDTKERLDYYTNRSDDWCQVQYEKSEMKVVIAADETVLKVESKIAYYQMVMDFASKALDIIKARGFAIKNMVELRLLEAGK